MSPRTRECADRPATHFVSGGLLEVDGVHWDSTDTVVAQSRQLALVPRS